MFNGPDVKNYLGASCSFIHDLYLHIVSLKMALNNKTHGAEYNAEILEDSLKSDHHFDFPNNKRTVVSNTTNTATKVVKYFSEDAEQVNYEMHQLNSAVKYGFGVLENTRSTIAVDDNGIFLSFLLVRPPRSQSLLIMGWCSSIPEHRLRIPLDSGPIFSLS